MINQLDKYTYAICSRKFIIIGYMDEIGEGKE
jgi:hypothetical protein